MWSGPKLKTWPPSTRVSMVWLSIARLCSSNVPLTTATAPDEMSWSWNPVSFSGVQHSSQTSTWASR